MEYMYDQLQGVHTPPTEEQDKEKKETGVDRAAEQLETTISQAYDRLSDKSSWAGLWGTLKSKGEQALNETKKELEVVTGQMNELFKDGEGNEGEQKDEEAMEGSTETLTKENSGSDKATGQKGGSKMLMELSKKAQVYIDELDRDLEKIENTAGSYLKQVGQDVKSFLKETVSVDAPNKGDGPSEVLFTVPENIRDQIYSTRLDAQLHALHTSSEPFLVGLDDEPEFEQFAKEYTVDSSKVDMDCQKYPNLAKLHDSLVPDKISNENFWARYYYMRKQLADQEEKRKMLIAKATNNEEEEVGWDDDEDEDEDGQASKQQTQKTQGQQKNQTQTPASSSSRRSSDDSYDVVSKRDAKDTDNSKDEEEDEDDDWE